MKPTALLAALLAAACATHAAEGPRTLTIDERFPGPSLDPAWTVTFTNPGSSAVNTIDWSRRFEDGALVATHVEPATHTGGWSYVSLSRPLGGLATDFSLSLDMGWKSAGVTDMTNVFFTVYADDGSVLGHVGYHDAWTGSRGQWFASPRYAKDGWWPATKAPGWAGWESGAGSLGDCGTGMLTIARTAGVVSLIVGEKEVLRYDARRPAVRVEAAFGFAYDPAATMGELRIERLTGRVTLDEDATEHISDEPEPTPAPWVASAKLPPPVNPYNPPGRRTYECAKAASGRIDLDGAADVLVFGHDPFSDSGVSLQRITDGSVAWRAHVTALGTCRLRYHQVRVRVDGATIVVVDVNVQRVVETRDLATGRQISREVFDYPR